MDRYLIRGKPIKDASATVAVRRTYGSKRREAHSKIWMSARTVVEDEDDSRAALQLGPKGDTPSNSKEDTAYFRHQSNKEGTLSSLSFPSSKTPSVGRPSSNPSNSSNPPLRLTPSKLSTFIVRKEGKMKKKLSRTNEHQMYLDVGQKDLGKQKQCGECAMFYVIGEPDDEEQHQRYCREVKVGLTFPHFVSERVHATFQDDGGRVVEVKAVDQGAPWTLMREVFKLLAYELGLAADTSVVEDKSFFVYVCRRKIVGCLIVERIQEGYCLRLKKHIESAWDTDEERDSEVDSDVVDSRDGNGFKQDEITDIANKKRAQEDAHLGVDPPYVERGCSTERGRHPVASPVRCTGSSQYGKQTESPDDWCKLDSTERSIVMSERLSSKKRRRAEVENINGKRISFARSPKQDQCTSRLSASGYEIDCENPQRALLGVYAMWVHASHRRKGLAARLVDTARKRFIFGLHVAKHEVAFTPLTDRGLAFAMAYSPAGGLPLVYRKELSGRRPASCSIGDLPVNSCK